MKKTILIVLALVVFGVVGYHLLNPWSAYDRNELAKAGNPPKQSPQINTELAYARVEGEVYSGSHNGNYSGICNSPKMVEIKNHITSLGNFTVACNENKTAWATLVTLNSNDERYWCGDSQGNRASWKEKSAVFHINNTSCAGLTYQEGLPPLVEAKREAIFQAALSRDLEKLKAESSDSDTLAGFDIAGKSKFGLSGFTKLQEQESNISIFDLIPALLREPYAVSRDLYTWPSVAAKQGSDFTADDIDYMQGILTDEQIELFKGYYYTYPKITITSDGKWVNYSYFQD